MARLVAPYWSNSQKFAFHTDAGSNWTAQTNPTTYAYDPGDNSAGGSPSSNAVTNIPVQLGPTIISGPLEYAPQAIVLEWQEMSETDYKTLAASFNLQLGTMIDQGDNGYYGMLKLLSFNYQIGAAQKVGSVKAVFFCIRPANGQTSTVNVLSAPGTPTPSVGSGGSIPTATTVFYTYTWWTPWGESLPSAIFSATTASNNQAITIPFTFPTNVWFRRARLYAATTSGALAGGSTAFVMADIWTAFSPQWIDTTGVNGLTNTAQIPTVNTAYTGQWSGSLWQNG